MWWIRKVQRDAQANQHFNEDRLHLDLQPNEKKIFWSAKNVSKGSILHTSLMIINTPKSWFIKPTLILCMGSSTNHGESTRTILGSQTKARGKGRQKLLGMQTASNTSV